VTDFNDLTSPLTMLETRRSGRPRDMAAPGPSEDELDRMLRIAARVPDHGKIAPWRFLVIGSARRDAFQALLDEAYREEKPDAGRLEYEANAQFAQQAPCLVAVLYRPNPERTIPLSEQRDSAAAAAMQLENAATASGYVSGWLTGWAAYSEGVRTRLCEEGESVVGFFFIGSPAKPLEERPRPELSDVVRYW
jgi:nitroreductase